MPPDEITHSHLREAIASVVERFHRAGWIRDMSCVSNDSTAFTPTARGKIRILELAEAIREIERLPVGDEQAFFMNQFETAVSELVPSVFTVPEKIALIHVISASEQRLR